MDCLNCVEISARLHLYIDRELSAEEVALVQQHLVDCSQCECRFYFDMQLKRLIHERCAFEHAPTHLREAVIRQARLLVKRHVESTPEVAMKITADSEDG